MKHATLRPAEGTPNTPTLLVAAGGTGGHIFPGLAVADVMREHGWRVLWCGHPERMEGELVPAHQIELLPLRFAGLRGKGWASWVKLPFTLLSACVQAWRALSRARPQVVLGMGGYVAFPLGMMAALRRVPLVVHEQNAIAGLTNRGLARVAQRVLSAFPAVWQHPKVVQKNRVVGNPVARTLQRQPPPAQRYGARNGALRLLVLGGSLGAQALNTIVPAALARLPAATRPTVRHQCGRDHVQRTRAAYQHAELTADCVPFITDMAEALTWADVVVCRAGAMTVTEVTAIGTAALFVPLPHAVDDHQHANARYLSDAQAAWLCDQSDLTPEWLAAWLAGLNRAQLCAVAERAHRHAAPEAAQRIAEICIEIARVEKTP